MRPGRAREAPATAGIQRRKLGIGRVCGTGPHASTSVTTARSRVSVSSRPAQAGQPSTCACSRGSPSPAWRWTRCRSVRHRLTARPPARPASDARPGRGDASRSRAQSERRRDLGARPVFQVPEHEHLPLPIRKGPEGQPDPAPGLAADRGGFRRQGPIDDRHLLHLVAPAPESLPPARPAAVATGIHRDARQPGPQSVGGPWRRSDSRALTNTSCMTSFCFLAVAEKQLAETPQPRGMAIDGVLVLLGRVHARWTREPTVLLTLTSDGRRGLTGARKRADATSGYCIQPEIPR